MARKLIASAPEHSLRPLTQVLVGALEVAIEEVYLLRGSAGPWVHELEEQMLRRAKEQTVHGVDANARLGDNFSITHEYLAMMLAVRRAGVTEGIRRLEREGFLKAARAQITVTDRSGLRDFAGGSYGFPEAEYERLIGPMTRAAPQSS